MLQHLSAASNGDGGEAAASAAYTVLATAADISDSAAEQHGYVNLCTSAKANL